MSVPTLDHALLQNPELSNNPYPLQLLTSVYREKRRKMQKRLSKFSAHFTTPGLLIDGLCAELGEAITVRRGGVVFPSLYMPGRQNRWVVFPPPPPAPIPQTNFERDGGDGHYPPPSLHSLLSIYLIHLDGGGGSNLKHRVVQYIFLDVVSYLGGDKWAALIDHMVSDDNDNVILITSVKNHCSFFFVH